MSVQRPTGEEPKKTRQEQHQVKLRLVRALINEGMLPGEIKRRFAKQFDLTPRAAEKYMTEAYAQLREELGSEDHKCRSFAFWSAQAADKSLSMRERFRAMENLDRVLGNHSPTKQATTDVTGRDVDTAKDLTPSQAKAELLKLLGELSREESG